MSIPSDIRPLVDELYQVLEDTDRQATQGLFALRRAMSLFPENEILMQYFSSISNFQFCIAGVRLQAEHMVSNVLMAGVSCSAFKLHTQNLIKFLWGGRPARTENTI